MRKAVLHKMRVTGVLVVTCELLGWRLERPWVALRSFCCILSARRAQRCQSSSQRRSRHPRVFLIVCLHGRAIIESSSSSLSHPTRLRIRLYSTMSPSLSPSRPPPESPWPTPTPAPSSSSSSQLSRKRSLKRRRLQDVPLEGRAGVSLFARQQIADQSDVGE